METKGQSGQELAAEAAELRESEARFQSLFRDSVVGMVVASPRNEFLRVNPAFCNFLGYSEQELLGKTIQSVTHPDDLATTSEVIRQALAFGPNIRRFEKRYLHKNGQTL